MRAGLNISIKCRLISTDTSAKLISDSYVVEVSNARPPFPFPPHSGHRTGPMCRRHWTAFGCIVPSLCSIVFTVALTPARPWHILKTVGICSVDPMLNSTPARARLDSAPIATIWLQSCFGPEGGVRARGGGLEIWTLREKGEYLADMQAQMSMSMRRPLSCMLSSYPTKADKASKPCGSRSDRNCSSSN